MTGEPPLTSEEDESITKTGLAATGGTSPRTKAGNSKPVEEDYKRDTVRAGDYTPEIPVVPGEEISGLDVGGSEDEDVIDITVQTSSSWYPPLPIPEGVDQDNFQGSDNHPLHRGRWIIFLGYNKALAGTHYGEKYCETLSNRAHFKINGSGEANPDDVFISALTRAEIKQPMTIDFDFEIKEAVGQDPRAFQFALCTPDPRDGFIQNSNLYGKVMLSIQALISGDGKTHFWNFESEGGGTSTDSETWAPDLSYHLNSPSPKSKACLE